MPQDKRKGLQDEIRKVLASDRHRAYKPEFVFEKVHELHKDVDTPQIREAVWRLIASNEVELTSQRELKLIGER